MKRASVFLAVALLVAACESSPSSPPNQSQPAGQSQAPGASQVPSAGGGGGGGGDGAALAEAANAVTDWCALMPADLVAELVPGDAQATALEFPIGCAVSNQTQVVQVTYQSSSAAEPSADATIVSDLGENAWLEPTGFVDDAYLIANLFTDPGGFGAATLYVEVAGHDGNDHSEDVIAVARAVIEELQ